MKRSNAVKFFNKLPLSSAKRLLVKITDILNFAKQANSDNKFYGLIYQRRLLLKRINFLQSLISVNSLSFNIESIEEHTEKLNLVLTKLRQDKIVTKTLLALNVEGKKEFYITGFCKDELSVKDHKFIKYIKDQLKIFGIKLTQEKELIENSPMILFKAVKVV